MNAIGKTLLANDSINIGRDAINAEIRGLTALASSLDSSFDQAIKLMLSTAGRIVVVGMGKSGHVGKKIAATFASTGTPSLFVHPAEASHGDLGMITRNDLVLAISKSGESPELKDVLLYARRFRIPIVAVTAERNSTLGKMADALLILPSAEEACPLGLAPTTSTTMTLALGDALAVACLKASDFKANQFKEFHPGGKLGQKLTKVADIMHPRDMLPLVSVEAPARDAIVEMSRGRFGCVGIVNSSDQLIGIFTDGDLRRIISEIDLGAPVSTIMLNDPFKIEEDALIADVVHLFAEKRIPSVFVCVDGIPVGFVHIHDLFQRGFV